MLMVSGLLLGACGSGSSTEAGIEPTVAATTSTVTSVPTTAPPSPTTTPPPVTTTTVVQISTTTTASATSPPTGSYESIIQLAETLESIAPDCARYVADGESDVSQYPAADLSQPGVTEFFGIDEVGSCFGLFPGLFIFVYTSQQSRLHTTVTSAYFGCVLEWADQIQYVYGDSWAIDAPYIQDFPGEEVAQLTGGTFNTQPCETFMAAYNEAIGDDPPPPQTTTDTLKSLLGE
jgi:hypothetical protein